MARDLKHASREALVRASLVPEIHRVWSDNDCAIFKDSVEAVRAAADYIWGNFAKHRIDPQHWAFVIPYDNWPMHKKSNGHPPKLA